jgi:hypothetical protein
MNRIQKSGNLQHQEEYLEKNIKYRKLEKFLISEIPTTSTIFRARSRIA